MVTVSYPRLIYSSLILHVTEAGSQVKFRGDFEVCLVGTSLSVEGSMFQKTHILFTDCILSILTNLKKKITESFILTLQSLHNHF